MQRSALCRSRRELFPTSIYLQNLASIQLRTSLVKFARSPRTDPPGLREPLRHRADAPEGLLRPSCPRVPAQAQAAVSDVRRDGDLLRLPGPPGGADRDQLRQRGPTTENSCTFAAGGRTSLFLQKSDFSSERCSEFALL